MQFHSRCRVWRSRRGCEGPGAELALVRYGQGVRCPAAGVPRPSRIESFIAKKKCQTTSPCRCYHRRRPRASTPTPTRQQHPPSSSSSSSSSDNGSARGTAPAAQAAVGPVARDGRAAVLADLQEPGAGALADELPGDAHLVHERRLRSDDGHARADLLEPHAQARQDHHAVRRHCAQRRDAPRRQGARDVDRAQAARLDDQVVPHGADDAAQRLRRPHRPPLGPAQHDGPDDDVCRPQRLRALRRLHARHHGQHGRLGQLRRDRQAVGPAHREQLRRHDLQARRPRRGRPAHAFGHHRARRRRLLRQRARPRRRPAPAHDLQPPEDGHVHEPHDGLERRQQHKVPVAHPVRPRHPRHATPVFNHGVDRPPPRRRHAVGRAERAHPPDGRRGHEREGAREGDGLEAQAPHRGRQPPGPGRRGRRRGHRQRRPQRAQEGAPLAQGPADGPLLPRPRPGHGQVGQAPLVAEHPAGAARVAAPRRHARGPRGPRRADGPARHQVGVLAHLRPALRQRLRRGRPAPARPLRRVRRRLGRAARGLPHAAPSGQGRGRARPGRVPDGRHAGEPDARRRLRLGRKLLFPTEKLASEIPHEGMDDERGG
ncbi:hypothetical protein VFPBJ_10047 [Purpureocillium lilacinum]|uniref:Uncharacterized protein n=1 Tax=Purpureocillium lilacinum TaxID=33203 RepID=A0A179GAA6_PURLI|nr:hypothetical protein VFPBJ_10047 [Purpureocillium lilacinum]